MSCEDFVTIVNTCRQGEIPKPIAKYWNEIEQKQENQNQKDKKKMIEVVWNVDKSEIKEEWAWKE